MKSKPFSAVVAGSLVMWGAVVSAPLMGAVYAGNQSYSEAPVKSAVGASKVHLVSRLTGETHLEYVEHTGNTHRDEWAGFDALFGAWAELEIADDFIADLRQSSAWLIANDAIYDD